MLAKLNTFALVGIDAAPVKAEVDVSAGLPKTVLVGLPEMAVKESVHRIERALVNLGYARHPGRTVINLAPADLRKDAGSFDLPIALGLLVATGQLLPEQLRDFAIVGELALDGSVRPVKGSLSMAMAAAAQGIPKLMVPTASAREAAVVKAVAVYGVHSLAEAVGVLSGQLPAEPVAADVEELFSQLNTYTEDFTDVRGQEFAKRALVVAAAGGHNVLMMWTIISAPLSSSKRVRHFFFALGPAPGYAGKAGGRWAKERFTTALVAPPLSIRPPPAFLSRFLLRRIGMKSGKAAAARRTASGRTMRAEKPCLRVSTHRAIGQRALVPRRSARTGSETSAPHFRSDIRAPRRPTAMPCRFRTVVAFALIIKRTIRPTKGIRVRKASATPTTMLYTFIASRKTNTVAATITPITGITRKNRSAGGTTNCAVMMVTK
jgi:hypothetical protein